MRIADQVLAFVQRLHPAQRRAIKAALRTLETGGRTDSMPLQDDLEGFYRLRVGRFRIVYRYLPKGEISCEFIDVRATVYERFTSMQRFFSREDPPEK
ncbi:MAG: cytotoxic translational repressor of toxin-antitoxin stability system [Opitutae bacterium]|nr:cytotoxic translational repressor of toxin-antitoxin stability system [Opitutae bacterium]